MGAFWRYHSAGNNSQAPETSSNPSPRALSDATAAVLKRLNVPVELRYYALLDPVGASADLKAFAQRVDQLLSAYDQTAAGKLKIVRLSSQSSDSAAAFADGLTPFNLDKGDACYLGIVLILGTNKQILPRLSPEWEAAVEPDLTRALARLLDARQSATTSLTALTTAPPNAAVLEEIKHNIPDISTVSVADGTQILQAAALKEFSAVANDLAAQLKDAQQRLNQAQSGGSEADQQAAMKNLQEIQATQTAKLQEIAARSKARIDAFKQLKQASN